MDRKTVHEPPEYLATKLKQIGIDGFRALCDAVCTEEAHPCQLRPYCEELAFCFDLLTGPSLFHSLDSYASAFSGFEIREPGKGFEFKRLKKLESRVATVIKEIDELKKTPIVRELAEQGLIPSDDVLGMPDFSCRSHFQALLDLRNRASIVLGDPRKPKRVDFDSILLGIYMHIHSRSGGWHDRSVADILNDLFPDRREPFTESSLKQWRYTRDITDQTDPK